MPSAVLNVSVDCADPYTLCQFWSQVTGKPIPDTDQPGDDEVGFELNDGTTLLFLRVPEVRCYEGVTVHQPLTRALSLV
jgi:hypothetical protein